MLNIHTRDRGRTRPGSPSRRRRTALLGAPVAALLVLALQGCQDLATDAGDKASAPAKSAPAGGGGAPGSSKPDGQSSATPSASPTVAPDDACGLVTQLEADQLAGMSLGHGRAIGDTCTYTAPPDGPTGQVEVFAGESGKNYYDAEHTLHPDSLKPLADVGDEAYLAGGEVFLRVGEHWVSIRLVRLEDEAEHAKLLTDLALKVAGRL
ncbi:hypothetical protein ACFWVC_38405 [Streptomyces sp. NPDC058691]|uniref:hypothetical protein n=1 Tax=Streptomyces sp. NPDC058691 TaxID=3346601 RepID=UPI003653756D